jgi:pimeloyl-ACP methyl ester carboxylesterase
MEPFRVDVPESVLDDLCDRLARARFPEDAPDGAGFQGLDVATLRGYVDHWQHRYDWRRTEAEINQWPQVLIDASGLRLHVLHARCDDPHAMPLVLTHGWPGSIVEFLDCIAELRRTWHVVVVSMPGYGFSGPTTRRGVDAHTVAAAVDQATVQLGYDRYVAQGGDWGAIVTRRLGEAHADHVVAIHCNMLFAMPGPDTAARLPDPMAVCTEAERERLGAAAARIAGGVGYMGIQGTKPDALGAALEDSPVGLAGWILEKFHAWTDGRDGMPVRTDRLLDNLMLYWVTRTATSAARLYCESERAGSSATSPWAGRVEVPTGHAVYPYELLQTPRAWADTRYRIVHWSEQPRGGHFAAMEQPGLFCADLATFRDALG